MEMLKDGYVNIHLFGFLKVVDLNLKEILYLSPHFISEST
jgi:hypothetical protein